MNDYNSTLSDIKYKTEDITFDVEVCSFNDSDDLNTINKRINEINDELDYLKYDNWKNENHADKVDYCVAAGSGIIAGIIDTVFAGDLFFQDTYRLGEKQVNNIVMRLSRKSGFKGDNLGDAIKFLEVKYPMASDLSTAEFGGGLQHHLRDFGHHGSLLGLIFSIITQFTGKAYGTDVTGNFINVTLGDNSVSLIGKNIPEKLMFGTINWFMHLVSDMSGSSGTVMKGGIGTGIPGPVLSLAKGMSSLPMFKKLDANGNKEISVAISKLFNGTLLKKQLDDKHYVPFDLRTEIGLVTKHTSIIILNEIIIRTFYFIRRFIIEIKEKEVKNIKELTKIEPYKILPFKNKTISRMLTISLAVIETIDVVEAAIESTIKSKGNIPAFLANLITKINFVGIGSLTIAIASDISYAFKKNDVTNKRIQLVNEYNFLSNTKVFYKQKEMWLSAYNCGEELINATIIANKSISYLQETVICNSKATKNIIDNIDFAEEKNPGLKDSITDIMGW